MNDDKLLFNELFIMDTQGKKLRGSETHKMLREDNPIKNENLCNSTKSTTTSSEKKCKKGICKPLIRALIVLITLYALLWVLGYASQARYDNGIFGYIDSQYCGISKNGSVGLAKRVYVLGIEYYKEIFSCRYRSCAPVPIQSQKLPYGYSPSDRVVLVRDFNGKLAVASIYGILYTDFMYDAIGFDNDGSFWATFNHNSDGYEPQIDGFFVAPALENNKWRLVDNHGTPLTSAIYDEIEPPYNGINLRARIGRKWSTLEMADLYLIKLNGGLNQSADAIKYSDAKISNSKLEINEKYNDVSVKISNYIKAGTTWKCTSKSIRGYDVKSYFVFLSNNEALWLLETPNGNTFPVGLGIYRHENNTCKLSYLASNPLHQKISMYYGDNDIDFYITIDNNANISILSNSNDPFLFDEKAYVLKKHKIHFKPSSSLVNQTWGVDIGEKPCITFKTEYEALIEESDYTSSVLYFCLDNEQGGYIAIKSGDNLSDENLIGTWRTGYKKIYNSDLMKEIESYFSEMRMHREGLDDVSNQEFIFIDCTIN